MVFNGYLHFLLSYFIGSSLLPLYINYQFENYCSKNNCDKVEIIHLKDFISFKSLHLKIPLESSS